MVNRRFTQVATSDDEDESPLQSPPQSKQQPKRKRMTLLYEDDDDEEDNNEKSNENNNNEKELHDEEEEEEEEEEEKEEALAEAKPVGDPVRVSGKGKNRRKHFHTLEYDTNHYTLEDPVLLIPEDSEQKPYVAIIKDITQRQDGSMMMTGQWFYRPEEAPKKGGGSWKPIDTRELFYSFHQDEVPAESIMHKCITHFIPPHKQLPKRKQYPGFIIQKVYDVEERKLFRLTDKDFHNGKQKEINVLIEKTLRHIGNDLLDIETGQAPADQDHEVKNKRKFMRKNISPLDVSREEEENPTSDKHLKPETPGSCLNNASEHYRILMNFNALTGDAHRDKWLERMLQHIQYICNSDDITERDDKGLRNANFAEIKITSNNTSLESRNDCQIKVSKCFIWPDAAVPAIVALEKASHEALSSDFQKYNQKLRSLDFNLKSNAFLARRLLNGELEPSKIVNMTPTELKEGLTDEEIAKKEPDELQNMQMTDVRCSRCNKSKVGVRDIIRAGGSDRYQLECIGCGNSWYGSRDEVSTLTIDGPTSKRSNGTEALRTANLVDGEKKVASHRESDKSAKDEEGEK
ncbi:putative BAH domain, transcription elongation factor S-II, central domain-containing protein [Lupinus albus]|uniref:Putative BAH domain, transcription elongation factor S-II, central domain-containing protein n=1 Tax=Lupinus albus TaxID=3870 RepID=A0A6A4PXR6_LUPAL|nr:putative BAH domain, transcription elongation factor S-II, central domain-containing protein [Lupinus albus]